MKINTKVKAGAREGCLPPPGGGGGGGGGRLPINQY